MGKLILYGDLAQRVGKKEVEISTRGKKVIDILREFARKYNVQDLLFKNDKLRPLYLILIDGRDYYSLGLLNTILDDEKEIRIIPTFHGGTRFKQI
ncbi:MAG: hypothetical protein ACTSX9_00445 [Candidatus Njordarchaeales archaeon]